MGMNAGTSHPKTLTEAVRYFSDPDTSLKFFVSIRWADGVVCPHCGSRDVSFLANQRRWQCRTKHPRRQFSAKVGTIFEDSPLSLEQWMVAVWLEVNAKNSISSYELHRALGVTQKSAWFMLQRVRLALQGAGVFEKLSGEVEVDETFIGGKARNMHPGKRKAKGRGAAGKAVVMGLLQRHGEVRTLVVDNTKRKTLQPHVREHVEKGAAVFTDALASYAGLSPDYVHQVIDHAECYVKGNIHTNGLENFWSLFKRCIKGTHISVEPFHLFRYLDAESYRFNCRKMNDGQRFLKAVGQVDGRRLTYKSLIGESEGCTASDNGVGDVN
jgi:transposase-like protein